MPARPDHTPTDPADSSVYESEPFRRKAAPETLGYPARSDETPPDDFLIALNTIVGSQLLTARVMKRRGSGAIPTLSATLSGGTFGYMAGISAARGAVEVMTQALAAGPELVRIIDDLGTAGGARRAKSMQRFPAQ